MDNLPVLLLAGYEARIAPSNAMSTKKAPRTTSLSLSLSLLIHFLFHLLAECSVTTWDHGIEHQLIAKGSSI